MATPRRRLRSPHAGTPTARREEPTPRKKAGRPKGPPSTIVNLRLPLELLTRLERYSERLESHTGLKAHRGMIARRALELFERRMRPTKTGRGAFASHLCPVSCEQMHTDKVFLQRKALRGTFGLTQFYTDHGGRTSDIATPTGRVRANETPRKSSASI